MKYSLELKVALMTIILIIIFLIYVFISAPNIEKFIINFRGNIDHLPSIEDIKNDLKTGDLIFLSGNNYGSKSIRWATSSFWSHIAIVIVLPREVRDNQASLNGAEKKDILLWECDSGQGGRKGARLINLSQKLNRHKGYRIGGWKRFKERTELKKLFKFINKYINKIELQDRIYNYIFSRYGPKFLYEKVKNRKKWYCSELVARTYQHLGVLDDNIDPCSISPEDFYNSGKSKIKNLRIIFSSATFFRF